MNIHAILAGLPYRKLIVSGWRVGARARVGGILELAAGIVGRESLKNRESRLAVGTIVMPGEWHSVVWRYDARECGFREVYLGDAW